MHMVGCVGARNFGTKFFLRRGARNFNLWNKGKTVISITKL